MKKANLTLFFPDGTRKDRSFAYLTDTDLGWQMLGFLRSFAPARPTRLELVLFP